MSLTAIAGPPIMTNLFKYFSKPNPIVFFPGAAFLAAAFCCLISFLLAWRAFHYYMAPK